MKKIILYLLLLFFILPNYASNPDIIITPEKCLVNSSVYIIFQWRAPYAVENFNVTVFSDGIVFKNSTLYYAGVAEDVKILHIFEGKAIKPGIHTIKIQMEYFVNGVTVKKKFLDNITILSLSEITTKNEVENVSEIDINNITILKNITENTSNTSMMNSTDISINDNNDGLNKTNANVNITNPQENKYRNLSNLCTNNETSLQSVQNTQDSSWIIYGIFGLVLGMVFGFVVMYIIKI